MATLKGSSIASTYDSLVKRADSYVQTGTNVELMNDSAVIQPTGLYLESGATTDNVGIGIAAPAQALDIKGSVRIEDDGSTDTAILLSHTSDDGWLTLYKDTAASVHFHANGDSYISDGKLGIGTNAPDGKLHVWSATAGSVTAHADHDELTLENSAACGMTILSGATSHGTIAFGDAADNNDGILGYDQDERAMYIKVAGVNTKRFVIDTNSRISLGNNDSGGDTSNTIFGYLAGDKVAGGGTDNTLIGNQAGNQTTYGITTGDHNTAVGSDACGGSAGAHITGSNNTAVGSQALLELEGAGNSNTAVGRNALQNLTTGSDNIAVGVGSGATITTTTGCVLVGLDAGNDINHADANGTVAIGKNAGAALTSGDGNTALGYLAATDITTGASNTVVGYEALTNAQSAVSNSTAIGYRAGYKLGDDGGSSHSSSNTMVGYGALGGGDSTVANNTAMFNTAVGIRALGGKTIGSDGTPVTATNSVAIGHEALDAVTAGYNNVAIGKGAGPTIVNGSFNICIGTGSDVSINAADNRTAIGYGTVSSVNHETVIGAGSVFKFLSKDYTCDFCKNDDGDTASSDSSPLRLPAYSIIKSISVIVSTLSDLSEYDVAIVHSSSSGAVSDDAAPGGTPVEILGAGVATTVSGSSAGTAMDINLAEAGEDGIVKQTYYNNWDGAVVAAALIGSDDRFIHIVNADGNGDSNPTTDGIIKVLVEYIGLD